MRTQRFIPLVLAAALVAAPAHAQGKGRTKTVPPGQMPPPGLCRIWLEGVPPGRQPAPTDCATAQRNRPAGSRVLYGASAGGEVERRRVATTRRVETTRRLEPARYPSIREALMLQEGRAPASVSRLAPGAVQVRAGDYVNGSPRVLTFLDSSGRTVAVWRDGDGDGRAERITRYVNGRAVAVTP